MRSNIFIMIMISNSNILFSIPLNLVLYSVFFAKSLKLGILFSTAVRAVEAAKLEILRILLLT